MYNKNELNRDIEKIYTLGHTEKERESYGSPMA